ncbi:ATP-grasp domain-containing protein [Nannocystis radixulma]|uniref:ATP-grasp domain-containing protein n=1 Tax=Nannocystis radixulma TaxID=2995305 RepID=A0ABT5BIX3_9BACT|nr:hypothetical protein [Nannocystis radixulma]MDC0672982.1 hypothetical protein [Nannocystis radixulma]
MPRPPKLVVLAHDPADDPCVELVAQALAARGVEIERIATGPFPAGCMLELEPHADAPRIVLGGVRLDDADALWLRHLDPSGLPPGLRDDERAAALQQAGAALWAALACSRAFLLDPPEALLAAPHKPRAMQLAAGLGIDVPRTLVTNSPAAVRRFAAERPGPLVCKLVDSGGVHLADPAGPPQLPTLALDDLDDLDGLELAPMIVQERLDKRLELRVTIVGHEVFVAGLDPRGALDVRMDRALLADLRPSDALPPLLRDRLLSLCTFLGLNFASIDVVRTADDRWVMLDLNTTSYFDHVERFAGLSISAAVADLLLGRKPPRAHRPLIARKTSSG